MNCSPLYPASKPNPAVNRIFVPPPTKNAHELVRGPDGKDYANNCVFLEASSQKIIIRHLSATKSLC